MTFWTVPFSVTLKNPNADFKSTQLFDFEYLRNYKDTWLLQTMH